MKAVILAGGYGTRIAEETHLKPKPMIEIGGRPILWHILKMYSAHGVNDFVICCGYKGYVIKEFFANYFLHTSDVTFDVANNKLLRFVRLAHEKINSIWEEMNFQNNKAGEVIWEGFVMKALDDGKYPFITNPNYCSPAWQKQRIRW